MNKKEWMAVKGIGGRVLDKQRTNRAEGGQVQGGSRFDFDPGHNTINLNDNHTARIFLERESIREIVEDKKDSDQVRN